MQLISFQIKNFRSIIDTGWVNLSVDNVTALVGQNESGKTAVLEALATTFSSEHASRDDFRHGAEPPSIRLATKFSTAEIDHAISKIKDDSIRPLVKEVIKDGDQKIVWRFDAQKDPSEPTKVTSVFVIERPDVATELINKLIVAYERNSHVPHLQTSDDAPAESQTESPSEVMEKQSQLAATQLRNALFALAPNIVLFDEETGLLPDKLDITDDYDLPEESGTQAVWNFLSIANVDLKNLVTSDNKDRAGILKTANKKISEDFLEFWSQAIGEKATLQLECGIQHHPATHEKAGKPYLEFLITDASAPLYPKQRSRGTRWFISFFLQLRASSIENDNLFFLLDEPGANLHEKAQGDVLTLLEKIRESIGVIYSTHSPHLMNDKYFHRILAVERDPVLPEHPTRVIGAHALGAASRDTLSPIFTMMGVSLSRQTAIKKHNNVILEELSSYYYLRAFWILVKNTQEVHFLPATGTQNVSMFAQLFLGWGLDFLVVLDDEPSGQRVYKSLKRDLFLDDPVWADQRMLKVPGCEGIEDIFEQQDYKNHVLSAPDAVMDLANAKWAKKNGAAKAIHALKFLHRVERGEVQLVDLQAATQQRVEALVDSITSRLKNY